MVSRLQLGHRTRIPAGWRRPLRPATAIRLADPYLLWLFIAVLGSALSVVRHAEQLAMRLGEPYGTLLLTLSVTFVEVSSIAAIMPHGANIGAWRETPCLPW